MTAPIILALPGVYRITDAKSGAFYIGSSTNMRERWARHRWQLSRSEHGNPRMQNIWSVDSTRLTIKVLRVVEEGTREALLRAEQQELDAAQVGRNPLCMNVLAIAGSHLGTKRSQETIERLRLASTGKKTSDEAKAKQRAAKLGKPLTPQHRANMGVARRGQSLNRPKGVVFKREERALAREDVIRLRLLRKQGVSWKKLANEFSMSFGATIRCGNGETYKDVPL